MRIQAVYPTEHHERAARAVTTFFAEQPEVEAVILMGSCARGKAAPGSCLDFLILVPPPVLAVKRAELEARWETFYNREEVFKPMLQIGKYSHVDLDFMTGQFPVPYHGWTTGPDNFELEIGNTLAYTVPLWERGDTFQQLKTQWLPYYDETLRTERLAMARKYCLNNLHHIPEFVERGLYFQSFTRLYDAFGEFLQALFISRKIYPIAYDKWVREQIEEILGLPELYQRLPRLFEITHFESQELAQKGRDLEALVEEYVNRQ